jgi:hypothetical protein
MPFCLFADLIVALHLAFVAFVLLGGLLVLRWPAVRWVHLPAAAWGTWVELAGWVCPLTPLENWLRARGGGPGYTSTFVEHYLIPLLYPASLTPEIQWSLAALVFLVNAAIYATVLRRRSLR